MTRANWEALQCLLPQGNAVRFSWVLLFGNVPFSPIVLSDLPGLSLFFGKVVGKELWLDPWGKCQDTVFVFCV